MLKQQLRDQMKQAMLAKDSTTLSVLRMLISAIGYFEIQKAGAGYEATDEDVLVVIQKEVKQHKDSIEQFQKAGRDELVEKETKELEILQKYLPAQMTEEEIKQIIVNTINQTGANSITDIGKIMSQVMPQTKGKADGGLVNKLVKEALSK